VELHGRSLNETSRTRNRADLGRSVLRPYRIVERIDYELSPVRRGLCRRTEVGGKKFGGGGKRWFEGENPEFGRRASPGIRFPDGIPPSIYEESGTDCQHWGYAIFHFAEDGLEAVIHEG
jgi:hypothetical protein